MVSVISTIHVIDFFKLSNPTWLAVSLSIAFEVGAAACLASLIALDKMNKSLIWMLFFLLTAMQAMGNTYYAFVNLGDFQPWSELFGLIEEEEIFQKRILSIVSGAILPIVALGFIKSLVDYIRPEDSINHENTEDNSKSELIDLVIPDGQVKEDIQDISEPLRYNNDLQMMHEQHATPKVDPQEIIKMDLSRNETNQYIATPNIDVVNANSNKVYLPKVDMPIDPDINPTRL